MMTDSLKNVRSVWFDLDDTLYDFQAMMRRALEVPLERIHQLYPDTRSTLNVEKLVRVREEVSQSLGAKYALERVRLEAFRETLRQYANPNHALADELQSLYLEARFAGTRPFDDVVPCLQALQGKYTLGLLSNGNSRAGQIGVESFFQFFVLSEEVNMRKPDVRIFNHATELTKHMPNESLYIGDSPEYDIVGASNAGWQTIWLNRGKRRWPELITAPKVLLQIESLNILPQRIQ